MVSRENQTSVELQARGDKHKKRSWIGALSECLALRSASPMLGELDPYAQT